MKRLVLLSLILVVFFTSCQNNESKNHADFKKAENGLMYKFYIDNEGDTPNNGDVLDLLISCDIDDSTIIIPNGAYLWQMNEPFFSGDIYSGLSLMHKGDSASFLVRADSMFLNMFRMPMPQEFSADAMMRFEVKLNDFYPESELMRKFIEKMKQMFPDETKKSEKELQKYLNDNGIDADPTETGLYYCKIKDGNGEKPEVGKEVKVHYTGKLLDGTIFDSSVDRNEPYTFELGIGEVIPGWDEGLQLMSKGEKGVLYIPYYLAYGNTGSGLIPPFATLIFEVELIDF